VNGSTVESSSALLRLKELRQAAALKSKLGLNWPNPFGDPFGKCSSSKLPDGVEYRLSFFCSKTQLSTWIG
jgi:hypothetical protein